MSRGPSSRVRAAVVVASLALFPASAAAQGAGQRVTVWFSGGLQAASPSLGDQFEFLRPVDQAERAVVDADYRSKAGLLIDGGFALRIRRSLGLGLSISRSGGDARADVVAQIPYPFAFGRFREVSGRASGLDRSEIAYHVQLRYSRPLGQRLRLVLSGGPTIFSVRRQILSEVQVDEEYPYDTATFRDATSRTAKGTDLGFHAGADVAWTLGRHAGVGFLLRYTRGSADLEDASRTLSVDTGGVQSGVGLRLYF
jgi:hypothetical protein